MRAKAPRRRPKYKNQKTVGTDGFKYDSKKEMVRGEHLRMLWEAGEIRCMWRQFRFDLPGNTKLILDFAWIDNEDIMHFEDVKSPMTEKLPAFQIKKRQAEELYDINIDIVY